MLHTHMIWSGESGLKVKRFALGIVKIYGFAPL